MNKLITTTIIISLSLASAWASKIDTNLDLSKNQVIKFDKKTIDEAKDAVGLTPKKFRMCMRSASQKDLDKAAKYMSTGAHPEQQGLLDLKVSGSGQFTVRELDYLWKELSKKGVKNKSDIWIIDLRKETHGFANDAPIALYQQKNQLNVDRSNQEILKFENDFFENLNKDKPQQIAVLKKYKAGKDANAEHLAGSSAIKKVINVDGTVVYKTEKEVVEAAGMNYKRFYVLDHHRPQNAEVDRFILFYRDLEKNNKNAWLHFHCKGGKGRTTSFMVMYDMLKMPKM